MWKESLPLVKKEQFTNIIKQKYDNNQNSLVLLKKTISIIQITSFLKIEALKNLVQ